MEIRGRTALVTGGAIRLGRSIALALAERGARVGITYRESGEAAAEVVELIEAVGTSGTAVRCDQREPAQIEAAVRRVEDELGGIDILVNSAAIFRRTPFAEATLEDWDEHLEVNLRGPWLFARAIAPGMKSRGSGVIVNMLDIAAERPFAGYLPYSASKAGLASLTAGLARVLAPEVRVNGIAPGTVLWPEDYSEAQKEAIVAGIPLRRAGDEGDIVRAVLYLVQDADFVTGAVLPVDGGRRLA